jgi:hypothetical protein
VRIDARTENDKLIGSVGLFFTQDHWHSSVDLSDELVWFTGYDGAGVQPFFGGGILL